MKLKIDNLDGLGARDYTSAIDSSQMPRIMRRLNRPAELRFSLVADSPDFVVPVSGARVTLGKTNGQDVFTGYLTKPPEYEYLGWGERGPVYRYSFVALSDEISLDRKRLSDRSPFVDRGAGDALRQLAEELLPGAFDTTAVEEVDRLPWYAPSPQKKWSEHAAEIALRARASYRVTGGALMFSPIGAISHTLDETALEFSPGSLKLHPADRLLNDLTVAGRMEPSAYVKDYFVGDGFSMRFYMSQTPFMRGNRTLVEEEYKAAALDGTRWQVNDPASAITVAGGKLRVEGGTGVDGQITVCFIEKMELGGAFLLQHGDVAFSATSDGVLGGLYPSGIAVSGCLAGFRVLPNGAQSRIQALINGALTGSVFDTEAAHHYVLTTRFYSSEIYREGQRFHSSVHPGGNGRGGAGINADVRVVLEVHDIDPAAPGSLIEHSTVLYDGVIAGAPGFCTYALVNSASLHCMLSFTRLTQVVEAEVRSALPGQGYRTRLTGSLADGAECLITQDPALQFFPQYVPAPNELIEVRYRGRQRALARVADPASISAHAREGDDGVRAAVWSIQAPPPRTTADCENAALALLDDVNESAWAGEYAAWSTLLPEGAVDIFPGDAVAVKAASRGAEFRAIVREVGIEVEDLEGEHSLYKIRFADEAAEPLGFDFEAGRISERLDAAIESVTEVGTTFLADLTGAEVTQVTSTSVTLDSGVNPPASGGIEVRWSDFGWGQENDRNLVGRFTIRSFTVPRLARVQGCFLRQYDGSVPPKYSRHSAALHLDYPL